LRHPRAILPREPTNGYGVGTWGKRRSSGRSRPSWHGLCLGFVASNPLPPTGACSAASSDTYRVEREGDKISLFGDLRMHDAAAIWSDLHKKTGDKTNNLLLELSNVKAADSGVVALLVALRGELSARDVKVEIAGANARTETIVSLYAGHEGVTQHARRKPEGAVIQIGRATFEVLEESKALLDFLGSTLLAGLALVRNPRACHWKDVAPLCEKAGADAVPIVVLINFLVGFVMAFMSAKQLKLFGANIYVADLVGISLTRELAPLMTAIIVTGRSGAAFAAELGSMKVNEEIDALRTLGLTPFGWLVLPRVVALIVVVPILTLIADFVGIAGGMLVGVIDLELTQRGYVIETLTAVHGWDVATGLLKCLAFAAAIGLIACQQGFAATGGAEGVGRRTTSSVVTSLFTLVVLDAAFTVIFRLCNL
jgi:phospholipid/cholesterol/gamma-HCH transport system permease protein